MKNKPFILGLIALLLVAGIGGYFLMKEKGIQVQEISDEKEISNETIDWKTYRNEKYGFEFQYPPEWRFINLSSEDYSGHVSLVSWASDSKYPATDGGTPENEAVINIIPTTLTTIPSKEFIIASVKDGGMVGPGKFISSRDFLLNGNTAREFIYDWYNHATTIYVQVNNKVYELEIGVGSSSDEFVIKYYNDEFQKILSTFKFIK